MVYSLEGQQLNVNKSNCSCRFFAEFLLHEIQFDVLVTGHIGASASQLLRQRGIEVIANTKGNIDDYLQVYVGRIELACPVFSLN